MKKLLEKLKNLWDIKILIIIALNFSLITILQYFNSQKKEIKKTEQLELYKDLQDSIKSYKNKEGKLVESISVLESSNYKYILDIKSKDSTVIKLQDLISTYKNKLNKPGGTAIVIEKEVYIDTVFKKDIEYVVKENKLYLKDSIVNRWVNTKYERNGDTSKWNIKVKDDFMIAVVPQKNGKKFIEITNNNPYSTTKNMKIWQFNEPSNKSKKWGIGIQIGYGVSSDNITNLKPFIGVGLSRNILTF